MHIFAELGLVLVGTLTGGLVGFCLGRETEREEWLKARDASKLNEHATRRKIEYDERNSPR